MVTSKSIICLILYDEKYVEKDTARMKKDQTKEVQERLRERGEECMKKESVNWDTCSGSGRA